MVLYFVSHFIYYLFITLVAHYIPGDLLLQRYKLTSFQRVVLSIMLGMVLWAWQAWIFGLLQVRWLTYLYLVVNTIIWMRNKRWNIYTDIWSEIKSIDRKDVVIIALGIIFIIHNALFNGVIVNDKLIFLSVQPGDQTWHAALSYAIAQHIPPMQPAMSGVPVSNYHIWGDMIAGEIVRVFNLPVTEVLFQYYSIVLSLFLGLTALTFAQLLKLPVLYRRLLLFFLYFGADASYWVLWLLGRGFHFRMGALETASILLVNYPRAFAVVTFFAASSLLVLWIRTKDIRLGLIVALMLSATIGMKINVGLTTVVGSASLGLYFLIKKQYRMLIPLIVMAILSLVVYVPTNSGSGGLIYTAFWRVEDFIVHPELQLSHLELARHVFFDHHNWIRVLGYDLLFTALYLVVTFGTRIVAIVQTKSSLRWFPIELHIFLLTNFAVSMVLGLFFIQASGGSNSFNFISTVIIIGTVYSALAVYSWHQYVPKWLYAIIIFMLIIGTIPRSLFDAYKNYRILLQGKVGGANQEDRNLYTFIKDNTPTDALFLSGSFHITFLAQRAVFISPGSGSGILESHNISPIKRLTIYKTIESTTDATEAATLLMQNHITHLLGELSATESSAFLKPIYNGPPFAVQEVDYKQAKEFIRMSTLLNSSKQQ